MVSGAQLAVAGWNPALPLSGAAAAAMDPQDPTRMLAVGSGFALQWKVAAPYADSWAQVQAISGLADLVSVAWSPDGWRRALAERSSPLGVSVSGGGVTDDASVTSRRP